MRTDEYYSKRLHFLFTGLSLILYLFFMLNSLALVRDASSYSYDSFLKNYDKQFSDVVLIKPDVNIGVEVADEYSLEDLQYDPSTLFLDWSEIEAERARIEAEAEEAKQQMESSKQIIVEEVAPSTSVVIPEGSMALPDLADTSFKGYMCLHKVTSVESKQWEFLHSGKFEFHTDSNGILKYNDYYVVALASYYTDYKIGSTFRITLDSGIVFDVITGDAKADKDTDALNMYRPKSNGRGEIVEFLIACGAEGANCNEYNTMSAENRALGNLSSLGFQGNVAKIEKLDDYSVVDALYN